MNGPPGSSLFGGRGRDAPTSVPRTKRAAKQPAPCFRQQGRRFRPLRCSDGGKAHDAGATSGASRHTCRRQAPLPTGKEAAWRKERRQKPAFPFIKGRQGEDGPLALPPGAGKDRQTKRGRMRNFRYFRLSSRAGPVFRRNTGRLYLPVRPFVHSFICPFVYPAACGSERACSSLRPCRRARKPARAKCGAQPCGMKNRAFAGVRRAKQRILFPCFSSRKGNRLFLRRNRN